VAPIVRDFFVAKVDQVVNRSDQSGHLGSAVFVSVCGRSPYCIGRWLEEDQVWEYWDSGGVVQLKIVWLAALSVRLSLDDSGLQLVQAAVPTPQPDPLWLLRCR
jgi:hypothetical protein